MHRIVSALVALTLLVGGLGQAQASTIIYNDLYVSDGSSTLIGSSGADSVTTVGPLADSFSTGASGAQLTDVQLLLAVASTSSTGSVSVDLYSDNATSPGSLLDNIGTVLDSSLTTAFKVVDFSLGSSISLAPDTRYWIQLTGTADSSIIWSYTSIATGTGVGSEYLSNYNAGFQETYQNGDGGDPYQMQLSANVAAVPQPGTFTLLGAGLAAIVGIRLVSPRRRRESELNPAA